MRQPVLRRATILFVGAVLVGVCFWESARADDGAIEAVGGTITPMTEHPTIEMSAEYVHAWVSPESVRVECVFIMRNRGPATEVTIGFPCTSDGADVSEATPFRWFRSWVDAVPVRIAVMTDSTSRRTSEWARSWWVKRVSFAQGQTRCIRDEYVAEPGSSVGDYKWFEYTLLTGATWLGRIGSADIVVTMSQLDGMVVDATPEPTSWGPHELRWHFSEIKPGRPGSPRNINVNWHPRSQQESEPRAQLQPMPGPTPMTGRGVDRLPAGCVLRRDAHRFAPGINGWEVTNRPHLWAVEYRWEFVAGGAPPGWYTPERLLALGDSLHVDDSNHIDLLDCGATLRMGIEARDLATARTEALRRRPKAMPPELDREMRPILAHAIQEYMHAHPGKQ